MRKFLGDAVVSTAALGVVLLALITVDDRVREQFAMRFDGARPATTQLVEAGTHVRDWGGVVFEAARDQSVEHAPLMLFVFSATAVLLFMFRTT